MATVTELAPLTYPSKSTPVDRLTWPSALEWRHIIGSPYCSLNPAAKHVITVLSYYGDRDGQKIFPGTREVAYRSGTARNTVMRALTAAQTAGWLHWRELRQGRGYRRRLYTLTVPLRVAMLRDQNPRFWDPPYERLGSRAAPSQPRASVDDLAQIRT